MERKRKNKEIDSIVEVSKQEIKKEVPSNLYPTGSDLLDLVVGGGYPAGKIINVVGDKSTGKSYLATEFIASARKKFGDKLKWFYDDAEAGFSFDTKEMYGFSILPEVEKDKDAYMSITIEEFAANLKKQLTTLKKDETLIYVLDSLDALTSEAEVKRDKERQKALDEGKEYDKGTYGMQKQKFLSEFFRLRVREIKNQNCILIIISQVRHNIGVMFGEKYVRSGGKALDFYAHTCLWLAEVEKYKKQKRIVGVGIKAKTKKAKIATPFRECFIDLIFDYGIDNVASNLKYLYDLKTDLGKDKKKEKIKWDDKEYTLKSLISHIEDNGLEEELTERVKEKWNEVEKSISSQGRKKKWNTSSE